MVTRFIWLLLTLAASGCATIMDGSNQVVAFESQPSGAKIFVNGMQMGVTPLTTQVKRSRTTVIVAKKEGYQEQQLSLQTRVNITFWGNILCGGVLGSTTDYASDAMFEYSPNMYFINLERLKLSQAQSEQAPVSLSNERRIRNFILRNYANLTSDIARGDGEYLSSLYSLLGLEDVEYGPTLKRLKVLASRNREALSFTKAVLRQFPTYGSFNGKTSNATQSQN